MTSRNEIVAQIIAEEVSGLADETFRNSETIRGTLSVRREEDDKLDPPSSLEAIETDASDYAGALVDHQDFVPGDPNLQAKLESISYVVETRLGVPYRAEMFKATHNAKLRIKALRESKSIDLSNLRHAVVSEYIEVLNEHLRDITEVEKDVTQNFKNTTPYEVNAKAYRIIGAVTESTLDTRLSMMDDAEELERFDEETTIPLLRYLNQCEENTRFAL
jgi:hypothetical protein